MLSKALPPSHSPLQHEDDDEKTRRRRFWLLTLGCIGVVYGDIGTSPLYAFREAIVQAAHHGVPQAIEVYGVLSIILWALIIVVSLKYVLFLLHIDNRGEGGILSLMALAQKTTGRGPGLVLGLGIIGAALFYGDAIITPAISVLSAIEGLKLVTPAFDHVVLPLAALILFGLFAAQKKGTEKISFIFGPVTTIWFLAMAAAGLSWIFKNPDILHSFNPYYAVVFVTHHGWISLVVLGAVFLAVTGAEALYTDLGHFGLRPIQMAWLGLVFPCLVLNYLGQGAFILSHPEAIENPFYLMLPEWALIPMVGLATAATIIASQAVITGAYSLTRQAINLGLLPRFEIRHTSADQEGQIYMPKINTMLLLGVLLLCFLFGNSSALASAYGIAVTGTMLVTTMLAFIVLRKVWKWGFFFSALATLPFMLIEIVFLGANLMKVFHGGYVPLLMAGWLILLMGTWVSGTRYINHRARKQAVPLSDLMERLERTPLTRIPGTAIFLTSEPSDSPQPLLQNIKHNKILHEKNIILAVVTSEFPRVDDDQKVAVEFLSSSMARMIVTFGFMETPDIPKALDLARRHGLEVEMAGVSFFLGKRSIISDARRGLPEWQDHIYISLARSASAATDFYRLPYDRVVEMGMRVNV